MIIVLAIILFFSFNQKTSSARINGERQLKNILICEGDSLWSIAKEYHTELDGSLNDYIAEIRTANNLSSNVVHSGTYVIIPYYQLT